ncbi:MAG TPA: MaoC family dehydratase [Gaiellales bacterium]|nr:MaoC family dehydratase [Gaiellales bacterium]
MSATIGQAAERVFHVSDALLEQFGDAVGDRNPLHFDDAFARSTRFGGRIAHGMLVGGFLSALLGMELPGPGTVYLAQELRFRAPVRPGDDVRCRVEVEEVAARGRCVLATTAWVGDTVVAEGRATVLLPG